ncbi:MAG: helix-turn-helix transcriptional regulator [Lewinellaceae bacterium]|nr:helix-turn-helix transcriptional regulator [Lewinellaceae bacterium]
MDYQLIWPSLPLRPYLQFYGLLQQSDQSNGIIEDLIPPYPGKGLIFSLEEQPPARIHNKTFDFEAAEGYFMPQCTRSWHMRIGGRLKMLGIFFRPGMFRRFFKLPAPELTDQVLRFEDAGIRDLTELQQRLLEPGDIMDKIQQVESFLKKRLGYSRFQPTLTDRALFLLQQQGPACSVDALKAKLRVSSRYFRKIFNQDIGIPPKAFLRICRFNMAFQLLRASRFSKLSDIAYELNYCDQSHFIMEFKHFTGTTPLRFMKQEHPLHERIYWREERAFGTK